MFVIDSKSATVKLAKLLDYETLQSYALTIQAKDGAGSTVSW